MSASTAHPSATTRKLSATRLLTGGFLGLTWGSSLRAWMTVLALHFGERPQVSWSGTFGGILVPAAIVGMLLALAAHEAQTSTTNRWRWSVLAPLLLMVAPAIITPDFFTILFQTGLGGGAIMVALIGTLGGYAFSGFGPRWTRWLTGAVAILFALAAGFGFFLGDSSGPIEAGAIFGGMLFVLLMAMLIIGTSTPARLAAQN
jgi:hypothetical protein